MASFAPDPEILQSVPADLMFRYNFLPYRREGGRLVLVMADPADLPVVDELAGLLQTPVQPAVGAPGAIQEALKRGQGTQRVLEQASESFKLQLLREDDKGDEVLSIDKIQSDQSPIIRLVDTTIFNALQRRASDIHLETMATGFQIKYRIDGSLLPRRRAHRPELRLPHHQPHQGHVRAGHRREAQAPGRPLPGQGARPGHRLPRLDHAHHPRRGRRDPHPRQGEPDGGVRLAAAGHPGLRRERAGALPPLHQGTLRHGAGDRSHGFRQDHHALRRAHAINTEEDKIITIEDPVEYQLKGITQIPVNEKKGLTFARGLRSILRHDPDKVMVGEIRDPETADIAIAAALTGHLVFTTVHANNVLDVLGRFQHMGVEVHNFVSALNCVQAQRLVRTICEHCKHQVKASRQLLVDSGLSLDVYADTWFYQGAGCIECGGTGYKGRMAISELLDVTDNIRELILARRSSAEIKRAAREEGMTFLRESAVAKALRGVTTLQEINKVTFVEVA